jgi:hypothetical protein
VAGGATNGHSLALIMPDAAYRARTNMAFEIPVHPGVAPVHPPNPTCQQITETNRQFQRDIDDHQLFLAVREALKQQIRLAVEYRYLQVLEDADMGFADIMPATILAHLKTTYGAINQEDIEANRALLLGSDFSPDDPIVLGNGDLSRHSNFNSHCRQEKCAFRRRGYVIGGSGPLALLRLSRSPRQS